MRQTAYADTLDAQLFGDTLSCELVLPASFEPGRHPAPSAQAESLLLSLAQVEDHPAEDVAEDKNDTSGAVQRVNAKLDLILALLSRLVRQSMQLPPPRAVRWSALGLRISLPDALGLPTGTTGMIVLQVSDWLPDRLELPAKVLGETMLVPDQHALWLGFPDLPTGLSEALERHLFRLHRRQVAQSRRR